MSTMMYHDIQQSDTLQSICDQYDISTKELRRANNFRGMSLKYAPSKLIIPIAATTTTTISSPSPSPRSSTFDISRCHDEHHQPRPSSVSKRLSAYDDTTSFRPQKKETTVEDKIVETCLAVKVLSLSRNNKQETITTFTMEDRMARFQKPSIPSLRIMEQQQQVDVEKLLQEQDDDKDNANSSSEESETELERRRASYRATANSSKNMRKQKMQEAKKYRKTRRLDGSSVLQEHMAAEEERRSTLQKCTPKGWISDYFNERDNLNESNLSGETVLSMDDEDWSDDDDDNMSSHLPGLKWKPKHLRHSHSSPPTNEHNSNTKTVTAAPSPRARESPPAKNATMPDLIIKKNFNASAPIDEDLTIELQRIMRDKSLTKYEKELRCEELKNKSNSSSSATIDSSPSPATIIKKKKLGRAALLAQFDANSKSWMKSAKKQASRRQSMYQ